MSDLNSGFMRFVRELRETPREQIPRKIAADVRPNVRACLERAVQCTGTTELIGRHYRGLGLILVFHEVQQDVDAELRTGCSPAQLRNWIERLRAAGRDIVTLDEALQRLKDPSARPFAVISFDDAYRDTMKVALPVLEELQAPMTAFVPTGAITGSLFAWWLGLRELFKSRERVDIAAMNRQFSCPDLPSKARGLRRVSAWLMSDFSRAGDLTCTFDQYGISLPDLVAQYCLNEKELLEFSSHRLVTTGAHTDTHPCLADLDDSEVATEISSNKAYLERIVGRRVDHFAYPFGSHVACGSREASIAEAAGFRSAVTTRPGHLFPNHLHHRYMLPRQDAGAPHMTSHTMHSLLHGINRAITTRLGDPVSTSAVALLMCSALAG